MNQSTNDALMSEQELARQEESDEYIGVNFEPLPSMSEQELARQKEFDEYIAHLHSEMYAWLTVPRKFYRFDEEKREISEVEGYHRV